MSEPQPHTHFPAPAITRHEINEDRANRDAFKLCVLILITTMLALIVAGILAWNSRIMLMPIAPRLEPRAEKSFLFAPSSESNFGVTKKAVFVIEHSAARLGVGGPRTQIFSAHHRHALPARFRSSCGRALVCGAKSDASVVALKAAAPGLFLFARACADESPVSPAHARVIFARCRVTAGIFIPPVNKSAAICARNRSTMAVSVDQSPASKISAPAHAS